MTKKFDPTDLKKLFKPEGKSRNGQVSIIGGSNLFHGAPLFSLKVASRIVDMVFFSSPEPSVGEIANQLKSKLLSFIWVPWEEVGDYIKKSDCILIGPGFMRYRTEKEEMSNPEGSDEAANITREITKKLLHVYSDKKWVIDAGSLQVLETEWIPPNTILTPNAREYKRLFGDMDVKDAAKTFKTTILLKDVVDKVSDGEQVVEIDGGNAGLSKGGSGDTLAGLTASFFAKNDSLISASSASFIIKKTADELSKKVGTNFNADDLGEYLPEILNKFTK